MQPLEPPDSHHLSSAIGWLELGNSSEAATELDRIGPSCREHPDVLEIQWSIACKEARWAECCALGESLLRLAPDRPSGWIDRAYALHEMKRTQEAWDTLLPAAEKFPDLDLICYNLACYACQLGRTESALHWLKKAMSLGDESRIRENALQDSDLAPMRELIRSLAC